MKQECQQSEWKDGLKSGIPIALGYFFVSFAFGIMGSASGLKWWESVLISMTNMTSAGQFAGVKIIEQGGSAAVLALSQLVINLRYSLMGISLAQNTEESFSGWKRALLGFGITDEIYGVSVNRKKPVSAIYFLGLASLPWLGWSLGTLAGALFGDVMPDAVTKVMGLALYGMFIAIVVPEMKQDRKVLAVAAISAAISCLIAFVPVFRSISTGTSVILCAVTASLLGAWLFPLPEENGGDV